MSRSSISDLDKRLEKLNEKDPLIHLKAWIDWEGFRPTLMKVREKKRKSNAGRKSFDVVMMFKVLIQII